MTELQDFVARLMPRKIQPITGEASEWKQFMHVFQGLLRPAFLSTDTPSSVPRIKPSLSFVSDATDAVAQPPALKRHRSASDAAALVSKTIPALRRTESLSLLDLAQASSNKSNQSQILRLLQSLGNDTKEASVPPKDADYSSITITTTTTVTHERREIITLDD